MRISAGGGKDSSLFIDKFRINVSSAAANSSVAAISKFYGQEILCPFSCSILVFSSSTVVVLLVFLVPRVSSLTCFLLAGRTDSTEAAYHNVRSEERSFPISTSKTRGYSSAASAEVVPPTPGLQTPVLRTFTGTSADVPGEFWNQLNPPALRRQTHRGPFNDPLLSPRNRARNIGESGAGRTESPINQPINQSTQAFNETIGSFAGEVDEERKETADAELERVRIKVSVKIPGHHSCCPGPTRLLNCARSRP